VLECVGVCLRCVLQCVAVSVYWSRFRALQFGVCWSVFEVCVAVCCSECALVEIPCVAVCWSVLQSVLVYCNVLQCFAVCVR